MNIRIRLAGLQDVDGIASILSEAAAWLQQYGTPMWRAEELSIEHITADVTGGLFFVAEVNADRVGTIKFQLEDPLFWPDVPDGESAFVHRLAVRRASAGGIVSGALLRWAADRARSHNRRFLRLDCEASRPRLRAVYERLGFRHHSDRQVGPYHVARYEQELR